MSGAAHSLIVGGSKGMGAELVERWAAAGEQVAVLARSAGAVPGVRYYTTGDATVEQLVNQAVETGGALQKLVFFQRFRGSGEAWAGELETSLTLTRDVIEAAVPHFAASGSIVMVGSIASQLVVSDQPVGYHVAKSGMLQMARYYALKLGPRGIRVNTVSAAFLIKRDSRAYHEENPAHRELWSRRAPLARMGTSEDLLNTIDLLCSPLASYLTAQNLVLDGGMSLVWPGGLL